MIRFIATTVIALGGICGLAACESDGGGQYDGITRFAGSYDPYYGPGSVPREPHFPDVPAIPAPPEASAAS
jgi:hypothetical protein